jgi:hypothetical protein
MNSSRMAAAAKAKSAAPRMPVVQTGCYKAAISRPITAALTPLIAHRADLVMSAPYGPPP